MPVSWAELAKPEVPWESVRPPSSTLVTTVVCVKPARMFKADPGFTCAATDPRAHFGADRLFLKRFWSPSIHHVFQ